MIVPSTGGFVYLSHSDHWSFPASDRLVQRFLFSVHILPSSLYKWGVILRKLRTVSDEVGMLSNEEKSRCVNTTALIN